MEEEDRQAQMKENGRPQKWGPLLHCGEGCGELASQTPGQPSARGGVPGAYLEQGEGV